MGFHGMTCFGKPKVFLLSKETANLREENTKAKKYICLCMHPYPNSKLPSPFRHHFTFICSVWRRKNKNCVCLPASPEGCFPSLREFDQIWFTSKIARLPMILPGKVTKNILFGTSPQVNQNEATASIYNHGSLSEERTLHRTVRESTYFC